MVRGPKTDPLTTEKLWPARSALEAERIPPAWAMALAAVLVPLTGLVDVD
jgi:hypothetical protein